MNKHSVQCFQSRLFHALLLGFSLILITFTMLFEAASASANAVTNTAQQLQTSCPATGTARAAVMDPIRLGSHSNLVYIFNDVPKNTTIAYGRIKRYDLVTRQKTEIVNSGIAIQSAQVSADGQWVLFLSTPDARGDREHSGLLQLVRIDGRELQTLYCVPADATISGIQWSTDQKLIAFAFSQSSTGSSSVDLLNIRTGSLQTELRTGQAAFTYKPLTWLDATRIYLLSPAIDGPSDRLFILDTRRGPNQSTSQLQVVFSPSNRFCWDADSSYDAKSLFTTVCTSDFNTMGPGTTGDHGPSTVAIRPSIGGTAHTIFTSKALALKTIRAVTQKTLLVQVENYSIVKKVDTSQNGLWKLSTDGKGFTRLTTDPNRLQAFNPFTQFPWSNVSRDSQHYALQTRDDNGNGASILFGSFNGGAPTTVATTTSPSSVALVGWTAM